MFKNIKITKKDRDMIITQSKDAEEDAKRDIKIANEVIRKASINLLTARAIIKNIGKV